MNTSDFEGFLKCPICFDYLNTCMITSCSHNYCSLCIRKYLTYKSQCPMCFEETSEPELRNNRLIDNMVNICIARKNPLQAGTGSEQNCQNSTTDKSLSSGDLQNHQPVQEDSMEKAPCPVCDVLVKVTSINIHLDMCLNRDERMDSLRRGSSVSKRKKLAKVIYHFLSDKELKKIVGDAGLNDEGDRQALIKRHKSYLLLYNSECDSLNPKPVSEIVKQVHEEETIEADLSKERQNLPGLSLDKKMDPEIIEERQQEYLKKHHSQFSKLVEDIQQRQTKASTTAISNRKPVSQNCDIDTPGTSKCETNNLEVQASLEASSVPNECDEEKVNEDDDEVVPSTDNSMPNIDNQSETEVSPQTTKPTKNKLSRKNTKEDVTEDCSTPVKRSRHPSDEF